MSLFFNESKWTSWEAAKWTDHVVHEVQGIHSEVVDGPYYPWVGFNRKELVSRVQTCDLVLYLSLKQTTI